MREKRRLFEIYIKDRNERLKEKYRQKNQEDDNPTKEEQS